MEILTSSTPVKPASGRTEVDTTRPFRSVKEAIAVFGDRLLSNNANLETAPKAIHSPMSFSSPSSQFHQEREVEVEEEEEHLVLSSLKKLEAELAETRRELMLLKERESETEVTVASLNAELHKNLSRLSEIEAAKVSMDLKEDKSEGGICEEEKSYEMAPPRFEYLPSLAQALSLGEMDEEYYGGRKGSTMVKKKKKKKKPIVPLIGELFSRKKGSDELHGFLYNYQFSNGFS